MTGSDQWPTKAPTAETMKDIRNRVGEHLKECVAKGVADVQCSSASFALIALAILVDEMVDVDPAAATRWLRALAVFHKPSASPQAREKAADQARQAAFAIITAVAAQGGTVH